MQAARSAGISPEDAEVTIRNGRMVIPVLAANKRQFKGFIHDESATGQTVFVEPTEVFDLNNEIRDLENAERREIINILITFTDKLRPESEALFLAYDFMGRIDFIDREIDPTTGSMLVQASFPNPEELLRPGQFAKVKARVRVCPNRWNTIG